MPIFLFPAQQRSHVRAGESVFPSTAARSRRAHPYALASWCCCRCCCCSSGVPVGMPAGVVRAEVSAEVEEVREAASCSRNLRGEKVGVGQSGCVWGG